MQRGPLADFVRWQRKAMALTQPELASLAGVGLAFLRRLETGRTDLQLNKVNRVLAIFRHQVGPIPLEEEKP
jgi:predicted transcriptional regulator